MDEDTDFKNSFAATTNVYSFRTIVVLAAQLDLWFYFFDTEITFQTNVIDVPTTRKYISLCSTKNGFNYAGTLILFTKHVATGNSYAYRLFAIYKVLKTLVMNGINSFLTFF